MSITLIQICNAIETVLAAAITYTQSPSEMTEGMVDFPRIQVYPNSGTANPPQQTDRHTFQAVIRQQQIEIYADLYATQRSEIGEDMGILLPLIDAIIDEIEKQDKKPYFALEGIKAFTWSWQRVIFQYNDPLQSYVGARFIFMLRVF